jgi:hypothetical protein
VSRRVEDHGRRHDRPSQAPTADFVDAGHIAESDAAQRVFQRALSWNASHEDLVR